MSNRNGMGPDNAGPNTGKGFGGCGCQDTPQCTEGRRRGSGNGKGSGRGLRRSLKSKSIAPTGNRNYGRHRSD